MKILKFAVLLIVFAAIGGSASGQGITVPPQVALETVNGVTRPIPGATVTVCAATTSGLPCAPPLTNTIFSNAALTQPLSNPFTADANGNYQFSIAGGNYTVTVTATGYAGYSYQITTSCAPGICTLSSLTVTGNGSIGGTFHVTGALTVGGGITASPFTSSSPLPAQSGALELSHTDSIAWRNNANGADNFLKIADATGNIPTNNNLFWNNANSGGGFMALWFGNINTAGSGAASGVIRLASSEAVAWRNGANSADVSLSKDSNDVLSFNQTHIPSLTVLNAQYTNSTTSFTTVLSFPVIANTTYTATCHLYYQAAATGGLNIEFTGPASPTSVIYGLNDPSAATTFNSSVATSFGTSLGQVVGTATTNFDAVVSFALQNGSNPGTVALQAKSSAAVQLQIQQGSYCQIQ